MSLALAAVLIAAVGVPHLLRLEAVPAPIAAGVWLAALSVRALAGAYGALFVVLYLPETQLYQLISRYCWHGVIPFLTTHLSVTGHSLSDVAILAPTFVVTVSISWGAVGIWRAARAVRSLVRSLSVGPGPGDSVILGDGQIMIAAAGLRHPRVVVSAGALVAMDDDELAAGLAHERGHIAHRHRFALMAAEVLGGAARFVPGTRHAQAELLFHLERDADQYAISRAHDPASLAGAICKAAESAYGASPVLSLGGSSVVRRLRVLLDAPADEPRRARAGIAVAGVLTTIVVLAVLALPGAAEAGIHAASVAAPARLCPG